MRRAFCDACVQERETGPTVVSNLTWVLAQLSLLTVVIVLLGVTYIRDPVAFLLFLCLFYAPFITLVTCVLQRGVHASVAPPVATHEREEFV